VNEVDRQMFRWRAVFGGVTVAVVAVFRLQIRNGRVGDEQEMKETWSGSIQTGMREKSYSGRFKVVGNKTDRARRRGQKISRYIRWAVSGNRLDLKTPQGTR
jgi:hypothetical protein